VAGDCADDHCLNHQIPVLSAGFELSITAGIKLERMGVNLRMNEAAEQRVLAVFLYHAGLSYRKSGPFVERFYESIR